MYCLDITISQCFTHASVSHNESTWSVHDYTKVLTQNTPEKTIHKTRHIHHKCILDDNSKQQHNVRTSPTMTNTTSQYDRIKFHIETKTPNSWTKQKKIHLFGTNASCFSTFHSFHLTDLYLPFYNKNNKTRYLFLFFTTSCCAFCFYLLIPFRETRNHSSSLLLFFGLVAPFVLYYHCVCHGKSL